MGEADSWCRFWGPWQAIRDRERIEYFRMSSAKSRSGPPYDSWSDEKRDALTGTLSKLINDLALFGVVVSVKMADWKAKYPEMPPDSAYIFCAQKCINAVVDVLKDLNRDDAVLYVYDAGDPGLPAFIETMGRFRSASRGFYEAFQILDIHRADKRYVPPLDAADFLAWQANHHVRLGGWSKPLNTNAWLGERIDIRISDHYLAGPYLDSWTGPPDELTAFIKKFGPKYNPRPRSQRL